MTDTSEVQSVTADSSPSRGFLSIATSWVGAWGTYVVTLSAFVVGWINYRDQVRIGLEDAFGFVGPAAEIVLFAVPLAVAAGWALVQSRSRAAARRRRDWSVKGPPKPGYFRTTPHQATDAGRLRADGFDTRILRWVQHSENSLLYLTGRSGTGKTSIVNAHLQPSLRDTGALVLYVRVYDNPRDNVVAALTSPGAIWKSPPADTDPVDLLARAKQQLRDRRLYLIIDQFEEFIILNEDKTSQVFMKELLHAVSTQNIRGITVVLVMRKDYLGPVREALNLPLEHAENNWLDVPLFVGSTARAFIQGGFEIGGPSAALIDQILEEAANIEESPGLFRPITLNMLGLVVSESVNRSTPPLPGQVLLDFVRRTLREPELRYLAPAVLRLMITDRETKRPAFVAELASSLGVSVTDANGTLARLEEKGLTRRLGDGSAGEGNRRWEIAHDFVADLLARVLPGWRETWFVKARAWAPVLLIVLWFGTVAALIPFYVAQGEREALAELRQYASVELAEEGYSIRPNSRSDFDEIWAPGPHGLWPRVARLRPVELDLEHRRLTDLSPLANLTGLKILRLGGEGAFDLTDIGPLSALVNLEELYINDVQLENIAPLRGLTSLAILDLRGTAVANLSSLQGMTVLSELYLSNTGVADLHPLATLSNLTVLELSGTDVIDLDPLRALVNLVYLDVSDGGGITNIRSIGALIKLESLSLASADLMNLEPLSDLKSLRSLSLRRALYTDEVGFEVDLSPLAGLAALEELNLSGNDIDDLEFLIGLRSLVNLDLSNTGGPISLDHLSGLVNLQTLSVPPIPTDFSVLAALTNLRMLYFSEWQMRNLVAEIDRLKVQLPNVSVSFYVLE